MKKSLQIMLLALLLLGNACRHEELETGFGNDGYVEFLFTKDGDVSTRADITEDGSGAFAEGDRVDLYARSSSGEKHFTLTLRNGTWTPSIARSELGEGAVTLTAYSPAAATAPTTGATYAHALRTSQKEAADYAASDLLFSTAALDASSHEVEMTFSHAMHRVVVTLKAATGELPSNLKVEVRSRTQGHASASDKSAAADADAQPEWIEARSLGGGRYEAIVYPQASDVYSEEWIRVSTGAKSTLFGLPSDSGVGDRFKAGCQTQVTLTLREAVSGTGHWLRFDPSGGEGSIEPMYLEEGEMCILPDGKKYFTKFNSEFRGWSFREGSGIIDKVSGQDYTMGNSDVTLYAVWRIVDLNIGGASEKYKGTTQWVDGITPPEESDWIYESMADYSYWPWKPEYGWYDVCQFRYSMCWAATASNIYHWWLDRNADYVERYGYDGPRKFDPENATDECFNDLGGHWGWGATDGKGNVPYLGFWWFLRGYKNYPGGAYFKDVFENATLSTDYLTTNGMLRKQFNEVLEKAFDNKTGIGMMAVMPTNHALTVWGARFDEEGYVDRIYYTNSQEISALYKRAEMTWMDITYPDGRTHYTGSMGNPIEINGLTLYYQNRDVWEEYFRTHPDK